MNVYNKTIEPSSEKSTSDFLFWWLAPILALLVGLGIWSNHFECGFHTTDIHTIVNNEAIDSLRNIPRFFVDPRTSADQSEYDNYQPLLTTTFSIDYHVADKALPQVFQIDTFVWFLLQLAAMYLLFALIPGSDHRCALLGAAIFAFHPVAAETVNYISRRGSIMGAFGVLAGMIVWLVWPARLPARIVYFEGVPQSSWDAFRKKWSPQINSWYQTIIHLPLGLYLIPVALGMLADPTAAVFAPILLVFMLLFDRKRVALRILPAGLVCGAYWVFQTAFTRRFAAGLRQPLFPWLFTQPLVAIRYFYSFFVPLHLSAVGDLPVVAHFWSPAAVAGYAGLAAIGWLAVASARRAEWRTVSFGLWWFLIALAPTSLIPQTVPEDNQRMYLAMAGLAFSLSRTVWIFIDKTAAAAPSKRILALSAGGALVLMLLAGCCWETYQRNKVWTSEISLWEDAKEQSPRNPVGYIRYANALIADDATDEAYQNLERAASLKPENAAAEVELAQAFDSVSRNEEAEKHFRLALASGPRYSPAFSEFAQWLVVQRRLGEALPLATHAVELNPWDMVARHVLLNIYSAENDWGQVKRVADETLWLDPGDASAQHARVIAQSVFDELRAARRDAERSTNPSDYLKLSVSYYQNRQFQESIEACRQALAIRPDLAEAYSNMAAAEYALGHLDKAEADLRETLRLRPNLQVAKNNLDYMLWLKAQPKK